MIIDFHTHIMPPAFRESRELYAGRDATFATMFSSPRARIATAEELVAAMDEAGVDVAVAMGVGWVDRQMATEANDYIIQSVRRFPDRLVGGCCVNPAWGEDSLREVERCAVDGIKVIGELHPDSQGYDLDDPEVMAPVMEAARGLGLIVLTHSSEPVGHPYSGKGTTTPGKLYAFLRNFPQNRVVCAHWGGGLPFYSLMPEVADVLGGVYFDTAASPLLYKREIFSATVSLDGAVRTLFGTDYPLISHRRLLSQIEEASIPPEARARILGHNAQALLEL